MYKKDGFAYGDQPLCPRVKEARALDDFNVLLTFTNDEKRVFDVKPLFKLNAFKPLMKKDVFNSMKVRFGTLTWDNDIDYCPDCLYNESSASAQAGVRIS